MTNPARELHTLLHRWGSSSKGTVFTARGPQNGPTAELWDDMLRAVRLLDEVKEGLRAVELLDANRRMLDSIAQAIFVPESTWTANASARSATAEQLGSLETWALILDRAQPQFVLEQADMNAVREAISEAVGILGSIPGLSEPHRKYIGELLSAALAHLSGEKPDLLAARAAFHEAVGALMFQPAAKKSTSGRAFLRQLAFVGGIFFFSQVGLPVVNGIASNVGSELLLEQFSIYQEVDVSTDLDAGEVVEGEVDGGE